VEAGYLVERIVILKPWPYRLGAQRSRDPLSTAFLAMKPQALKEMRHHGILTG
jgi:hypothetical protein